MGGPARGRGGRIMQHRELKKWQRWPGQVKVLPPRSRGYKKERHKRE